MYNIQAIHGTETLGIDKQEQSARALHMVHVQGTYGTSPQLCVYFVQPWVKRLGTTGAAHHVGQKAGHFKHLIAAVTLQGLPHTHETTNYSKRKQSNIAKRIRFNKFDDQKSRGSV